MSLSHSFLLSSAKLQPVIKTIQSRLEFNRHNLLFLIPKLHTLSFSWKGYRLCAYSRKPTRFQICLCVCVYPTLPSET